MAGYEVVIGKIADAGKAAQRVAEVIAPLDFAGAIPDGDAGMPGARAVAKLASVKRGWAGREQLIAAEFSGYAEDLSRADEFYRAHEDGAQHDLRQWETPRTAG
ncbi:MULTISPECIES: hypothetical protein [Amycolatopsis]|uniref:Uncharacterized protein n=2 Tax=Amycolatopsis TaxID=1813 RepID=A0A1I3MFK8_9PSEU|nr:hypothetical protein [Amycolatopsis sacchari]SFI95711.1 hypothetical protein SAMN05421835_102312 [Amycolatopsis sacchari]